MLMSAVLAIGCSSPPGTAQANRAPEDKELVRMEKPPGGERQQRRSPTSADPRDFETLDAYLAQLERLGATGQAWYREISPGTYEFVTTMIPAPPRRVYTRAQLMAQFGFTR
jgi:hypothetical protein